MATAIRSIFCDALPSGPAVAPRPSSRTSAHSSSPTIAIRPPTAPVAPTIDGRLIAILDAPLAPGETAMTGFQRKEAELGAVFATLSVLESRALHARLVAPKPGDELAHKFARLTVERRARLMAFLADCRRREALAMGRR